MLSPSGASVVFPVSENSGVRRLWLRSLPSMNAIALAGTEDAGLAFWSPGEEEIGFFANGRLKVFRLSDGTIRDLCAAPLGRGGSWNRKGVILFTPQAANGRVYRVDAAGGTPQPVTTLDSSRKEIDHRWPEFLKDGRHFVYTVHAQEAEHTGIYLATLDGGAPALLDRTLSQAHYADTPDGEFLLYVKDKSIRARHLNVLKQRLEGTEVTLVHGAFYMPATGTSFSVAGDRYLAYFSGRGRRAFRYRWIAVGGRFAHWREGTVRVAGSDPGRQAPGSRDRAQRSGSERRVDYHAGETRISSGDGRRRSSGGLG